jgi:transcriptional regulator with XRE-family HTH domain
MLQITLRAARVNCGFTLREVAQQTKRSVDTIIKYEKNSTDIPHDLMSTLLELYSVSIDYIFFGSESDFIGIKRCKENTHLSLFNIQRKDVDHHAST